MNSIQGIWKERHPAFLFTMMVVMMITGSLLSVVIGLSSASLFTSLRLSDVLSGDTSWMENIQALRWVQGINNAGTFLLPALLMAHLSSADGLSFSGARKRHSASQGFIAVVMIAASIPLISWLVELMESLPRTDFMVYLDRIESNSLDAIRLFLNMEGMMDLFLNTIVMALIPALSEEFLFRGYLQPMLKRATGKMHLSVWITALGFAILHGQLNNLLAIFLLGAVLGYLKEYSKSIWLPVLGHFTNNALSLFIAYSFVSSGLDPLGAEEIDFGPLKYPFIAFSAVMIISALYLIRMIGTRIDNSK